MTNNPHNGRRYQCNNRASIPLIIAILLAIPLIGCSKKLQGNVTLDNANRNVAGAHSTAIDAAPIIERYRALDDSRDSTTKVRASIAASEEDAPRQIQLNIYHKKQPDGRQLILIEFTAPPEERDRDGLITVFPDGQIEGVRYVQSTDSFIVTRDLMSEDALFGLTLQELADGQPEKYEFTISEEETFEDTVCYRAEGKLKQGAESKFSRVVLLISKQTFAAVRAEFFDNHNERVRVLTVSKTEQVAGHWTRLRWTIDNLARHRKIIFEAVDVRYDQNLKDSIFTREHLKTIASR
jgi:hypothetical protein